MKENFLIYNFTLNNVTVTTDDQLIALIESSQTLKITIQDISFNSTFMFKSNSSFYSDEGNGKFSNNMKMTFALTPSHNYTTGEVMIKIHSIFIEIKNLQENVFYLNATTYPTLQIQKNVEDIRVFILSKINEMVKMFKADIQAIINQKIFNVFYSYTSPRKDKSNI